MKFLKYLIPQFLKKADAHLLQNYPIIWETKIHFILFYSTIVANLSLFGLAWLMPIDFKFVPSYDNYVELTISWSAFSAFLMLCFYFYQQSFIRIKVYTFKETVLRYGMYVLAVVSFGTNILALPQGITFRVRQAYSKEEIKKDFFDLARTEYLTDLTKFILNRTSESESSKYFAILKNSPLNKNKEVSEILQGLKDYNEIIDKKHILDYEEKLQKFTDFSENNQVDLEPSNEQKGDFSKLFADSLTFLMKDHKRIHHSIENHPQWNKDFKKQLISRVKLHKTLDLSQDEFFECNLELSTTTSKKILPKYASARNDYKKYYTETSDDKFYDDYSSYYEFKKNGISNLCAFYHTDLFLNTKYDLYTSHFFEGINDYIIGTNNFDDRITDRENHSNQDILLYLSEKEKDKYMASLMDEKFVNAKIGEFLWKEDISEDFSIKLLAIFIINAALLLLATKFFSFRNLFISGFGMMAGAFSLAALLYFDFFKTTRKVIFGIFGNSKYFLESYISNDILFIYFISFLILCITIFFALYLVTQKANYKWLKTLFVFLLCSTMALQIFGVPHLEENGVDEIYTKNLFYLYETLVLLMFALYYLYNRMLALPLKK